MSLHDHNQKLGFYRAALDFSTLADAISDGFPRGRANLADQLRRASTSIALNVAEGAGEFRKKDKARFYRFAIRSATECQAALDIVEGLGFATEEQLKRGRELLATVIGKLTVTVRRFEVALEAGEGDG